MGEMINTDMETTEFVELYEHIVLTTEQGIGIGDGSDELPNRINMRSIELGGLDSRLETDDVVSVEVASPDPDFTVGGRAPALRSGTYLVIDGTVAAFGAEDFQC